MPKSAIINLAREGLLEEIQFKRLALLFDALYVDQTAFHLSKCEIECSNKLTDSEKRITLSELDWLCSIGIIKPYQLTREKLSVTQFDNVLVQDVEAVGKNIYDHIIPFEPDKPGTGIPDNLFPAGVLEANNELILKIEDIRMRIDAALLSAKDPITEFVPIVNSFASYQTLQSADFAAHFVLKKLPVPNESIPWEQLFEFKKDEDIKRKYYSLITWINEMSQKDMPVSHLVDEYNQLYSEYVKQYSLHKMNTSMTSIELLITAGVQFVSSISQQNFIAAFKDLITIRKQHIALLKSEKEIKGRELAYIFSANERFQ